MIRTLHRVRGASALGAHGPGDVGPFGPYGGDEDDGQDDDKGYTRTGTPGGDQDHGDGLDDEQHDHDTDERTAR